MTSDFASPSPGTRSVHHAPQKRRFFTPAVLSASVVLGLVCSSRLVGPDFVWGADPQPLKATAPAQQRPVAQPFSRNQPGAQPAAPAGQQWAQNPGLAQNSPNAASGLVPPTGIQRAAYEQLTPAQESADPFAARPAARQLPEVEAARPLLEGPDGFGVLGQRPPVQAPVLPRMAPEAASTHSVNLPERLPALGGDPFAQSPQSSGGDVLLPQAQPPANNNMRVQLDAQFQNQAKNNMRVQLDPQFQRVEGPAPQPVPAQPPIPPANLMLGAELDYSPRPNQEPVRQNPPPRQPVPQARDPFDAELDGRTLPAGAMDLSLPRMDPAPAQPLGNPGQIQPLAQPKPDDVHEVKSGENYWTISRQYYGSARFFSALAEYNRHRIADPNKMRPGMYLLVPDVETLHQRYPKLTGGGPEAEAARIAATRPGFFLDKNARPAFRVGKGDTLTEIAQKHLGRSTGWTEIYRLNKALIPDPNNLKLGTVLQLPPEASQVAAAPELQNR